jgi:asparagine synthase (glutamine-hydrolysing)
MCGILALLCEDAAEVRLAAALPAQVVTNDGIPETEFVKVLGSRQAHRGPDAQAVVTGTGWALAHQRLAIMDPIVASNQPFRFQDDETLKGISLVHNGEIYNHEELYARLVAEGHAVNRHTKTDSEVIMHCYAAWGWKRCVESLRGMFAFVLIDERDASGPPAVIAARDHVGIKPLYLASDSKRGITLFSSELKAIQDMVDYKSPSAHFELVPAGCAWVRPAGGAMAPRASGAARVAWENFWDPEWKQAGFSEALKERPSRADVRTELKAAVRRRMMSHVPYGALLSGGVDSCIVTSLMVEIANEDKLDFNWPDGKLRTYTVGMQGSPDIMAAREMARHLGSVHNERLFTAEEACEIVPKVVYHMETYEPELLRSAIPNYFLAEIASSQVSSPEPRALNPNSNLNPESQAPNPRL